MNHRAIQRFFLGFLIGFTYELVKSIWRAEVQKVQEDQHKRQCSEPSESYSRGGCDTWDLKPSN